MRALLLLLPLAGCGAIGGDNASFDVLVHDTGDTGIAEAIITLKMSADNNDHVCGKTDSHGNATLTWNACEFGVGRCERDPALVMAAASGYIAGAQPIGFSQSGSAAVQLEACDAGADCPDPTPCTGH